MQASVNFDSEYDIQELSELPSGAGAEKLYFFPDDLSGGGKDGILPRIISFDGGEPWRGIFSFGSPNGRGFSEILATPDPNSFCVVSCGRGFVVNASNPRLWREVPIFPIKGVRTLLEQRLLLFFDNTTLLAWASSGVLWKTERLSWDGLEIDEIGPEFVTGKGWDPTNQNMPAPVFRVALATGEATGGARPGPPSKRSAR